jgi:hypothetical protein
VGSESAYRFQLFDAGDGKVGIMSSLSGQYCGEDLDHFLRCKRPEASDWEQFALECVMGCDQHLYGLKGLFMSKKSSSALRRYIPGSGGVSVFSCLLVGVMLVLGVSGIFATWRRRSRTRSGSFIAVELDDTELAPNLEESTMCLSDNSGARGLVDGG